MLLFYRFIIDLSCDVIDIATREQNFAMRQKQCGFFGRLYLAPIFSALQFNSVLRVERYKGKVRM